MNQTFQEEGERGGECLEYSRGNRGGEQEKGWWLNDKSSSKRNNERTTKQSLPQRCILPRSDVQHDHPHKIRFRAALKSASLKQEDLWHPWITSKPCIWSKFAQGEWISCHGEAVWTFCIYQTGASLTTTFYSYNNYSFFPHWCAQRPNRKSEVLRKKNKGFLFEEFDSATQYPPFK